MRSPIKVSVVIPSLNESKTIGECIEKVKKVFKHHNIDGEIIVSDNSNDETPEIAKSLGAKVVTPDRRGYGYAYLYGFKHANGDILVLGDADGTYDFSEMPKLLEPILKGEADLVVGSRFKGRIEKGAMPWLHRYIGNPILTFILNLLFKAGVSDAHCGFRAIRRDALEKLGLKSHGMEFASEMILKASLMGLRIREVPITYYPRRSGKSKLKPFQDGWRHLKFMLLYAPSSLYTYPGLSLSIIGLLLMLLGYLEIYTRYTPDLHSIILGSFCLLIGFQLIFLGLFTRILRTGYSSCSSRGFESLILKYLTLGRGILVGLTALLFALIYLAIQFNMWVTSGFAALPLKGEDIAAFTLLTLGLQIIFNSILANAMVEAKNSGTL